MASGSLHLVDPELLSLLDFFPPLELCVEALPTLRTQKPPRDDGANQSDVAIETRRIPGPPGAPPVEVVIYSPRLRQAVVPCVLHIHGGGFVFGSPSSQKPVHRELAAMLGCVLVSVAYRLAPEARFPGAIEDCYATLAWLHANAAELCIDPAVIGVMGESAGGGLAAALALLARDRGDYTLAFQHLIYPMLDDRTCVATDLNPYTGEFLWTRANNTFGWTSLLEVPPGSEVVSPYAAPARATSLAGLPSAYIAVGALDLLLDEDLDYARRLVWAGVPVELHVYPGAFHAFDLAGNAARVAREARRDSVAALRRALKVP